MVEGILYFSGLIIGTIIIGYIAKPIAPTSPPITAAYRHPVRGVFQDINKNGCLKTSLL